ncbi:hypothetical protein [Streptomyces peucetius]|uniref:Uncharacterized protein n=1 Tax=Streptomyces peucetius TaxID=1950 RepID=A0ABY6I8S5_STRPE|nr:hypothetical protein [Streptomyces peucetius]UYQ63378.1 hypothetical protein OGH68_19185 [Streptomyces peucetius]
MAVLAGTFAFFNTNILTPERICHGWVTPDEASAALGGGPGRVSASEDSDTTCTIRQESWLPGGSRQLSLRTVSEDAAFPFELGAWDISGTRHVMTGGTHGAYDDYSGWALLPPSCVDTASEKGPQPVVRAAITTGDSGGDSEGMGRLLISASKAISSGSADCSAPGHNEPTRHLSPSAEEAADLANLCGVPGFRLKAVKGPKGERVMNQMTGSLRDGLYCDLTFEGDEEGPFARLAIVSDPPLVKPLGSRDFSRSVCGGKETVFAFDYRYVEKNDLAGTGLPDTAGLAKAFSEAARTALNCD